MSKFKQKLIGYLAVSLLVVGGVVGGTGGVAHAAATFFYATGSQAISNTGTTATMTIATPSVASGDFHSLMELSVQSSDQQQTVEVGWTVDTTGVNGTDHTNPHLFVYYWVNGVQKCYNTNCTGFVQLTGTGIPQAGQVLANSTGKHFGIVHGGTPSGWWVSYNDVFFGYYPDTLWPSPTFTTAGFNSEFMEVAANVAAPCTDGGNGLDSSNASAAGIFSVAYGGQPTTAVSVNTNATNSSYYSTTSLSARSFRVGGPGAC